MNSFKKLQLLVVILAATAVTNSVRAQENAQVQSFQPFGGQNGSPGPGPSITGPWAVTITPSGSSQSFSSYAYCLDRYTNIGVPSIENTQITTTPVGETFNVARLSGEASDTLQYDIGSQTNTGNGWLSSSWTSPFGQTSAQAWGQVAYIFDNYGLPAIGQPGGVNSDMAYAAQLAIWDVLGELGASGSGVTESAGSLLGSYAANDITNLGAQFGSWYDSGIGTDFATIMNASAGQTGVANYIARTSDGQGGYGGQALITGVSTPEGSSLLMFSLGAAPLIGIWYRRRQ